MFYSIKPLLRIMIHRSTVYSGPHIKYKCRLDTGCLHIFQILGDPVFGDVAVHPHPITSRLGEVKHGAR